MDSQNHHEFPKLPETPILLFRLVEKPERVVENYRLFCGKLVESLWRACGICGENFGEE
ncbi:MAG: hypothetical protein HC866_20765 [Leptolyngbyaceae cyanobacterium RU_5_1]|nr:hypothetical protein [Leptolyngbyaceae cyanobacterium RU_5_1]